MISQFPSAFPQHPVHFFLTCLTFTDSEPQEGNSTGSKDIGGRRWKGTCWPVQRNSTILSSAPWACQACQCSPHTVVDRSVGSQNFFLSPCLLRVWEEVFNVVTFLMEGVLAIWVVSIRFKNDDLDLGP